MPPSLKRDPSFLASLSSNSRLLALLSQHWSSQVITCSPGQRLKSFRIPHSSPRDRDQVVISSSVSPSCSLHGPASSSSFTKRAEFHVHFFLCIGMTNTGTGCSLIQLQCLTQGFESPQCLSWGFSPLFFLMVLHKIKQHLANASQGPAQCGKLCLSGIATAFIFQTLYHFIRAL